jgi:uncharacterized membrane protein YGL010W
VKPALTAAAGDRASPRYGDDMVLRGVHPATILAYAIALAVTVAATVFFGRAGLLLGLIVLGLVRLGTWALPLIKLSYAEEHHDAQPRT